MGLIWATTKSEGWWKCSGRIRGEEGWESRRKKSESKKLCSREESVAEAEEKVGERRNRMISDGGVNEGIRKLTKGNGILGNME